MNHREQGEFGDGVTIVRHAHRYGVTSTIVGGTRVDDVVGEPLVLRDLYMEGNNEFADVMVGSTVFIDGRTVFRRAWPTCDRTYSDEVIRSGGYFAAYEHCVFDRCVIFGAERLSFRECFMEDVVLVGEPASFRDNFLYDVRVTTLDAHYADFKQRLARAIGASS